MEEMTTKTTTSSADETNEENGDDHGGNALHRILTKNEELVRATGTTKSETKKAKGAREMSERKVSKITATATAPSVEKTAESEATLEEVNRLLRDEPELVMEVDDRGYTPLYAGIECRAHIDWLFAVLKACPECAKIPEPEFQRLPLHSASMLLGSSYDFIVALLEAHPEGARHKTTFGYTPLSIAIRNNLPEALVRSLLKLYPEATQLKTHQGYTPLHMGMRNNSPAGIVRALAETFADAAYIKAADWNTPLHLGLKYETNMDSVVAVLETAPKAASYRNNDERIPLHLAMRYHKGKDLAGLVKVLLAAYPEGVTALDKAKRTPLHQGLEHVAPEDAIEVLVNAAPHVCSMVDNEGNTPLHLSLKQSQSGHSRSKCTRTVLNAYPDAAKVINDKGRTALHRGIAGWSDEESLLLVYEAYPEAVPIQDNGGTTALHSIARAPLAYPTLLTKLIETCHDKLSIPCHKGTLPLHEAARSACNDAIISFVEAYPNGASQIDETGRIALFNFIETVYRGKRRVKKTGSAFVDLIAADTMTIQKLFEAYPAGAETICENGASPFSILISTCVKARSFAELAKQETCRRLRILLSGVRDGTPLRTLCTMRNPTALRAFFATFDEGGGPARRDVDLVPLIDLNKDVIPGWTLLEMMTDFHTSDSAQVLLSILRQHKGNSSKDGSQEQQLQRRRIKVDTEGNEIEQIEFDSMGPVQESVLLRVADRAKLSVGSAELKKWGQEYGRFLRRYRIEKEPKHVSESCVVVFGTEAREGSDGRLREAPVALKFMCNADAFVREIEKRKETNSSFVVPIKACFASDEDIYTDCSHLEDYEFGVDIASELVDYANIRLKSNTASKLNRSFQRSDLEYLLVMESGAGVDLYDFIGHQNVAGNDLLMVVSIAKEIARCLQFLNETCEIVHGDVKARNFVARGVGLGFTAIDLDNSASIKEGEPVGQKRTSSGYLPPEQAAVELFLRTSESGQTNKVSLDDLKGQLQDAFARSDFAEVARLSVLCEQAKNSSNVSNNAPPSRVTASAKYDMWCFGALLYYLSTGKNLFDVDTREEIEMEELSQLCEWTDQLKKSKLAKVRVGWPSDLLDDLLQKEPSRRPPNWRYVIDKLSLLDQGRSFSSGLGTEPSKKLFDRLMVFHSAPLAFIHRQSNGRHPIPMLNFQHEQEMLKEAIRDAETTGANIEVVFETATTDRFNAFFAQRMSRVMHLSSHGHQDYLALEDGQGGVHALSVPDLRRLVSVGGGDLQVVFVSACHSRLTGQAFVDAGVPHVVCCRLDEQFQDEGAILFAQNFYRALGCRRNLKEAFDMAREAVKVSANIANPKLEAEKFLLLPAKPDNDPYHNVDVFFTREAPPYSHGTLFKHDIGNKVPRLPDFFVGRELTMFEILECLNDSDVVRVNGDSGIGKSSVVTAVCRYVLQRTKSFPFKFFGWFPQRKDLVPSREPLYDSLSELLTMTLSGNGNVTNEDRYIECWRKVVSTINGLHAYLVIDLRRFPPHTSNMINFENFLRDVLNVAKAKIVIIMPNGGFVSSSSSSSRTTTTATMSTSSSSLLSSSLPHLHNKRESSVTVRPLDFHSTALMFGWYSRFVTKRSHPALRTPNSFASNFLSSSISNSTNPTQRMGELYEKLGNGIPRQIHLAATEMSDEQFRCMLSFK